MQFSRTRTTLVVLLTASIATTACGSDSDDRGGGSSTKASTSVTVGLVTDIGGLNDRSFNALANQGLEQADAEFDITGSVLESKSSADYVPNLGQLVQKKYDLAVGVGFLMSDSVSTVAGKSPDTNFAIIDFSYGDKPIKNVRGLLFKEQEAGYLAGILAGTAEKESTLDGLNKQQIVSAVGGQKIPPVDKYIAGFQKGVADACPGCRVLVSYSQDFVAQDKCKEQALTQIAQGSDIVFQVAGACGLGALDAADSKGVWGIGVDADQAYLGTHILTSALKRVDVAVYDTIKQIVDGTFTGGTDTVYSLQDGGVGLGKIADPARKYQTQVDAAITRVTTGKVEIPESPTT